MDPHLTPVAIRPKPVRTAQQQASWVNHVVWTERMLAALRERGERMTWHSLIDKVYAPGTL